ncbi:MAG: flagellar export protein FliJ [Deltaproteobacteria bacterium]|nr:flagellar export protein FliJ [Deltaproteobacteria bacterium]
MKFKFRFESLLSYREHLKEKAAVEFARAQNRVREINQRINALNDEIAESSDGLEREMRETMRSDDIINWTEFINALLIQVEIKKMEKIRAEQLLIQKRKLLLEKTKQCKVFEKLKEKDREKWLYNQNQLELKEINEAAIIRHGKDFL